MPYADIDKAYDDGEQTVVLTKEDLAVPPGGEEPRDRRRRVRAERAGRSAAPSTSAYYLEPDSASPKAYVLLRKTLEQTDRTAIVRFSLRQKTRLAALRVRGDVLVLQTLLWADEVREAAFPSLDEPVKISAKELELSASLVDSFVERLRSRGLHRRVPGELRTLIDAKLEKGDALDTSETFGEQEDDEAGGEVIDLMEALRASVERTPRGAVGLGEERTEAREEEARAARRRRRRRPSERALVAALRCCRRRAARGPCSNTSGSSDELFGLGMRR